jgi:hypothetical protein
MQPVNRRPSYPYVDDEQHVDDEQRKVARDAYVSWKGGRYSVPRLYAGKEVWVCDHGRYVEVRYGAERIAVHAQAVRHHQVVTLNEHHAGISLGNKQNGKTLIHIEQSAPVVERRPLPLMKVWPCEVPDDSAGEMRTTLAALSLTAIKSTPSWKHCWKGLPRKNRLMPISCSKC